MKRIFLLILVFVSLKCFGQLPINQSIGSTNTRVFVPSPGGLSAAGFLPITFVDTTAANLTQLDAYPGALVTTSSDNKLWRRKQDLSAWEQITTGGSGLFWSLIGNTGTNPAINFLGTIGNQDLSVRRNSIQMMRFLADDTIGLYDPAGVRKTSIYTKNGGNSGIKFIDLNGSEFFFQTGDGYLENLAPLFIRGTIPDITSLSVNGALGQTEDVLDVIQGATELFTIRPNGNVGINTTTPTALFHVQGADTIRLNGTGVPSAPAQYVTVIIDTSIAIYKAANLNRIEATRAGNSLNLSGAADNYGLAFSANHLNSQIGTIRIAGDNTGEVKMGIFPGSAGGARIEIGVDGSSIDGYIRGVNDTLNLELASFGPAYVYASTRFSTSKGANVAAANNLSVGYDGNLFTITGNTQINAITTYGWRAGSKIIMIFTGTPTVKDNTTGGAGTAPIQLSGNTDFTAAAGDVLTLIYDGTDWKEIGRILVGTVTGSNIYNSDGTLTGTRTLTGDGNALLLSSLGGFRASNVEGKFLEAGIEAPGVVNIGDIDGASGFGLSYIEFANGESILYTGSQNAQEWSLNRIRLLPPLGDLEVDSLNSTVDTSAYKPMVWNAATGDVRVFNYWPGGGGTPFGIGTFINSATGAGRLLIQSNAGTLVTQSANLRWDSTTAQLVVGPNLGSLGFTANDVGLSVTKSITGYDMSNVLKWYLTAGDGMSGNSQMVMRNGSVANAIVFNTSGNSYFDGGNLGIGQTTPTASLHIKAGSTSASTAPIKLAAGSLMSTPENGAIEYFSGNLYFTSSIPARGIVAVTRTVTSNNATETLTEFFSDWIFTGTTATWTLPAVATSTNVKYYIKNRGSGNLTINSNAGGNDIYSTSAVNTYVVSAGQAIILVSDGTFFNLE